jgi:adenylate kinase
MRLILLGAPGAGKGTQGALLAERHRVPRIATGELLREAVRRDTPLGREAKGYMEAGELVPDAVILGLIREVLTEGVPRDGFILDGFPRTIPQAEGLDRLLEELGRPLEAVVELDVPEDVLIKRVSGRRSCPASGAGYNIYSRPPNVDGICDACGAELVLRKDDAPDTVRRRLAVYREQTEPLVAHYRRSDTPVITVAGDRPRDEVASDIERALGS